MNTNDTSRTDERAGEIEDLVRGFESCALSPSDFKHREHLTVALFYLFNFPPAGAEERMRSGLRKFLKQHLGDLTAYNETMTLFWLRRVRGFLPTGEAASQLVNATDEMLASCADTKLIYRYYSAERLSSDEARAGWVEPDLRPLDF